MQAGGVVTLLIGEKNDDIGPAGARRFAGEHGLNYRLERQIATNAMATMLLQSRSREARWTVKSETAGFLQWTQPGLSPSAMKDRQRVVKCSHAVSPARNRVDRIGLAARGGGVLAGDRLGAAFARG